MSTVSPAVSSPPRHRDGNWEGTQAPPYPYEYDPGPHYSRGPPPPGHGGYYGHSPFRGGAPPQDYWSYDGSRNNGGYWASPPPYDGYRQPPPDRHMAPPPRVTRGPPQPRSPRPHPSDTQSQPYSRNVGGQQNRDFRPPQNARGGFSIEKSPKEKRKGDPLSILANVSAGMTGKDGRQGQGQPRHHASMPTPTSPLQRKSRPSPITPSQTPPDNRGRPQRHQITPNNRGRAPEQSSSWDYSGDQPGFPEYPQQPGYYPPRRRPIPPYGDYGSPPRPDGNPPALVERGSFDSQGDGPYREDEYPGANQTERPYYYDEQPYGPYWEASPHSPPGSYPPPRWNYGQSHESLRPEYPYDGPDEGYGHHRPPPMPTHHPSPYTFVQQPRLEEKTILRKKFSWKHYPELERFLIANRDDYLKHSNMNYTAEQKQYNNWLTERLLEVSAQHNYAFDPDDFNFVAIRDRIRCYYKSYVQTARKRGLKLPEKKKE